MLTPLRFAAALAAACLLPALSLAQQSDHRFDRAWLEERAQQASRKEYVPQELPPDSGLAELSYDQFRAIEFKREAAIWKDEGRNFILGLLHPGFIYTTPVQINIVADGVARRVPYSTDVFNYGLDTAPAREEPSAGYSGFRAGTPINRPGLFDEFLVFQGASYFRAVGQGDRYGLSGRGLALGTARPEGEEFPVFTEFWIERPALNATSLVVHALLDSRSVTGAYTFVLKPGDPTLMDVDAVLFPRRDIEAYGIGPLTSMFLYDATNRSRFDDFRPAVHDSDGLQIQMANGEQIWRPLANPLRLQVSAFVAESPKGFGLMQRDRDFAEYEDIEARYELRTSAWVEPRGEGWGKGHVELVEIPTGEEIHDNIVAFWHPAAPLRAGGRHEFSYRVSWGHGLARTQLARVVDTRAGGVPRTELRKFAIDFAADTLPPDLEPELTVSAGEIVDVRGAVVEATGDYRVNFTFDPAGSDAVEMRLGVLSENAPWSETWLYRWTR